MDLVKKDILWMSNFEIWIWESKKTKKITCDCNALKWDFSWFFSLPYFLFFYYILFEKGLGDFLLVYIY